MSYHKQTAASQDSVKVKNQSKSEKNRQSIIQQRLQDYKSKTMVTKLVEQFNVVDNPILNNNLFLKQFPGFSFSYASKFAGYKEISNDNNAFMSDYQGHSLFKKIPVAYQKLVQNYGTLDYKELDPKLQNLFSQRSASTRATQRITSKTKSQRQFMSPQNSMANTMYNTKNQQVFSPLPAIQNRVVGTTAKNERAIETGEDDQRDTVRVQIEPPKSAQVDFTNRIRNEQGEPINAKNQKFNMTLKSTQSMPMVNFTDIMSTPQNKNLVQQQETTSEQDQINENIQILKRMITKAAVAVQEQTSQQQDSPASKKQSKAMTEFYDLKRFERLREFEQAQVKLLEAAVALELRRQIKEENQVRVDDQKQSNDLHMKLLQRKLARVSTQKTNFARFQTIVNIKQFQEGKADFTNPHRVLSNNSLNINLFPSKNLKPSQSQTNLVQTLKPDTQKPTNVQAHIYSKEELLFHELQKMITKLTSNKSYEISFKDKFRHIEILKMKNTQLKTIIDLKDPDAGEGSIIKLSHTKFIDDMIKQLEKHYKAQYISHSKKRIQRESLKEKLAELEARDNQLRNRDFKFKKFYQKGGKDGNMDDIKEMKDYLKEIKDRIHKHYDYLSPTNKSNDQQQTPNNNKMKQTVENKKKKSVRFTPDIQFRSQQYDQEDQNDSYEDIQINLQQNKESLSNQIEDLSPGIIDESPERTSHMHSSEDQSVDIYDDEGSSNHTVLKKKENDMDQLKLLGTDYKDFDNIKEIIHEYFNPLAQNKQILQQPQLLRKKTLTNKQNHQSSQDQHLGITDQQLLDELARLDMKEIGTVEDIQRLITKSTSSNKQCLKNLSHHYSLLRKNLQKKLKDQDLEKLKTLSEQFAKQQKNISLSNSSRSGEEERKQKKGDQPMDSKSLLFHNLYGIQQLRMLANEHGIAETLDTYTRKNGILDDHLKDQIGKIKQYKTNLEVIERKFVQIAAKYVVI